MLVWAILHMDCLIDSLQCLLFRSDITSTPVSWLSYVLSYAWFAELRAWALLVGELYSVHCNGIYSALLSSLLDCKYGSTCQPVITLLCGHVRAEFLNVADRQTLVCANVV